MELTPLVCDYVVALATPWSETAYCCATAPPREIESLSLHRQWSCDTSRIRRQAPSSAGGSPLIDPHHHASSPRRGSNTVCSRRRFRKPSAGPPARGEAPRSRERDGDRCGAPKRFPPVAQVTIESRTRSCWATTSRANPYTMATVREPGLEPGTTSTQSSCTTIVRLSDGRSGASRTRLVLFPKQVPGPLGYAPVHGRGIAPRCLGFQASASTTIAFRACRSRPRAQREASSEYAMRESHPPRRVENPTATLAASWRVASPLGFEPSFPP